MSGTSTLVTAEHFQYIASHTAPEDDFLRRLKDAAETAGIPPIWIAPEQASFIQVLLRAAGAHEVVEIGTLAGYSAIVMARALPEGGRVRTIELNPSHAEFAERWAAKSNVAERVHVLRGAGMDVLPGIEDGSADVAFLDADKKSYPLYLRECLRIVRRGGLILVDNAFAFGELFAEHPADPETLAIRTFNEHIAKVEALQSVIVPLGDGMWVAVRK
jgi:predicted O-methyltransferase YrrM